MFRIALTLTVLAATLPAARAQSVAHEKYALPNGLKVILHENHDLPLAAVNLWVYVGSKDEPARRSGFAHLFEHLMFMGTERVPGLDFDNVMETGGGYNNATTSEDRTNYFEIGPASLLPTLLWLEADRLEDLGRMMTQDKLDRQREVVRNERRQSYENRPYGRADLDVQGLMFPPGHPYHIPVIGTHADLEAATVDDVQSFFATYYVPSNAALVVAGDFDPATIKPLIADLFGTLPRGNDVTHATAKPVQLDGVRRSTVTDRVQYPRVSFVYHSPAGHAPGDAELDLAAAVLSEGVSSRLYQRLVYQEQLAVDVSAYQGSMLLGSLFTIEVLVQPEIELDHIERVIDEVVAQLATGGPTAAELQQRVASIEFDAVSGMQSLLRVADRLNAYEFHYGDPDSFHRDLERYRQATPESVARWVKQTLDPQRRLILRVIPEIETPSENPRDTRPAALAERAFAVPQPTAFQLDNGVPVYHWQRPELPMMAVTAMFDGGAAEDAPEHSGCAGLLAQMLERGAGERNALEFANALDLIGAEFHTATGHTHSTVSMALLARYFDGGMALLADALQRPHLAPEEWERVRELQLADLAQAEDDPVAVAGRVSLRRFFGDAHPYGRPIDGTAASVSALSIAHLTAARSRVVRPDRATLFVAGSLSADATRAVLNNHLGRWAPPAADVPPVATFPAPATNGLTVALVHKPQAVQTVIRFTLPAVRYDDSRRNRLLALNTVLGGTFTSRLNKNLREDHGYTYGARSGYTLGAQCGYMTASSSVRADVTGAALGEFLKELRGIRTGNITATEAEKARSARRTAMVESLATLDELLDTAIDFAANGRSFDQLAVDAEETAGVTAEVLNSLAHDGVPLERGLLVLVGDRDVIRVQIADLGLPQPIELDVHGDPVD